ncbi:MAG: hypothetical protein JXA17_02785 [Dehalococcoidales bacterium]|nr:hypothetical protein [Dehalococcoidales bacterium]
MIFKNKVITRKIVYLVIPIFIISMMPMPLTGCSGNHENTTTGYVTETLTKRGIDFSFEYPDDYEKNEFIQDDDTEDLGYIVLQYMASTDNNMTRKIINVQLWNPTADWQDARTKLDNYADNLDFTGKDVEIYERSPLQVAGTDAEKMVFSMLVEDIQNIPNKLTGWVTAFDYGGQIWFLVVTTNMEDTEEVEADFVHLIESFKLLD